MSEEIRTTPLAKRKVGEVDAINNVFTDSLIGALTGGELAELKPLAHFQKFANAHGGDLSDNKNFYRPLYEDFDDFDYRHNTNRTQPIYLNDFDFCLEEDRQRMESLIRMDFDSDTFETIAQCQCGHLRGNHYLYSGILCPHCSTTPERLVESNLETKVWLRLPEGVKAFINPGFYKTFFSRLSTGSPKIRIVQWLIDSSYRRKSRAKHTESGRKMLAALEYLGIEPTLNSFVENADRFMEYFLAGDGLRAVSMSAVDAAEFLRLYYKFRPIIFPHHIPVPNRFSTIIEKNGNDKYVNADQLKISGIYQSIADTRDTTEMYRTTPEDIHQNVDIVGKALVRLAHQNSENIKDLVFVKNAMVRKHVIAGSLPFSGRGVITSTTGLHDPGVAYIPRVMLVAMMKKFITSHLYRLGFTPKRAQRMISQAAHSSVPEIDDYIQGAEDRREIVGMMGRNPTIQYLSVRAFFIRMNRDPEDESINLPILSAKPMNADKR